MPDNPTMLSDAAAAAAFEDVLMPLEHGSEQPGDHIGAYRLVEKLGEGGFGIVWRAEQERPLRREVALKLLKLGMDTRQVLARFEQERRVLAAMEHPGIATMFDAGVSPDGRPFFVMELLRGLPLTTFCHERGLSLRARIELFQEVCAAVQHAHQKGVIHRDLKPSNILVIDDNGRPLPKIIDFGIAKAVSTDRFTAMTLATRADLILGTPQYMSPEQIADVGRVDTRSDIYALGALLYELLTGAPPFDPATLPGVTAEDFRRLVREQAPKRPSTILSTRRAKSLPEFAPPDVTRLPADLDWITLRALEKEPQRRYASAAEFAEDLQRFLNGEPVLAHPPGALYVASRWVRRHRVAFAAACVCVLALVVGAGVALWQASVARAAQVHAESTSSFLNSLLDEVAAEVKSGRNPEALRLALTSSQQRLQNLVHDPDLQIELITKVADLFEGMTDRKLALQARAQRADMIAARHGADSAQAREARFSHLIMMVDHGDRLEASRQLTALRDHIEQHDGRGSADWFSAQRLLARVWIKLRRGQDAAACARQSVEEARRRLEGQALYTELLAAVDALESARRFEEAEKLLTESSAVAETLPNHITLAEEIDFRRVMLIASSGDHARAAELQRVRVSRLASDTSVLPRLRFEEMLTLCSYESRARQHEQALQHAQEALAFAQKSAADENAREMACRALLFIAEAFSALKQHDKAAQHAGEALRVAEEQGNDVLVSRALSTQAAMEEAAGHLDAAWAIWNRLHAHHAAHHASVHNQLEDLRAMTNLRLRQKRPADALGHAREAWRQALADPATAKDHEFLNYTAELALKAWNATRAADSTAAEPAELAAWQSAAR